MGLMRLSNKVVRDRNDSLLLFTVSFKLYSARMALFFKEVLAWAKEPDL